LQIDPSASERALKFLAAAARRWALIFANAISIVFS